MAEQTEKSYQKQAAVFEGQLRVLGRKNKAGSLRYWKNIGLGFKTPKEAIEGTHFVDQS
jgi:small subunit ribosomal protein S11e